MRYLWLLLIFLAFGCSQPKQKFTGYSDILHKYDSILELYGKYELPPDGTDSIWKKTYCGVNIYYVFKVMDDSDPLHSKWNELIDKSKKYDTFPQPTEQETERSVVYYETVSKVLKNASY